MTIGSEGRSLELYFINGNPDGMLTAEVFNWTGHVLMTPRTQLPSALSRKEAKYTGIYLLLGEEDGRPRAYIGESENISDRIRSHDAKLDWWNSAVLVTSAANNLNKAHVKYLEARLVEEALAVGRVPLQNGNSPAKPSLSESAQSNMESFLSYLLLVLPALRIDMFIQKAKPNLPTTTINPGEDVPQFDLVAKKNRIKATAQLLDGEFIVVEGSLARMKWEGRGTWDSGYAQLHGELCKSGILKVDGDHRVFTKSYAFSSPSAAAAVVTGRPAMVDTNGKSKVPVPPTAIGKLHSSLKLTELLESIFIHLTTLTLGESNALLVGSSPYFSGLDYNLTLYSYVSIVATSFKGKLVQWHFQRFFRFQRLPRLSQ